MAVSVQLASLVPITQLTGTAAMLFASPLGVYSRIDRLLVTNPTAASASVTIYLVPPNGTATTTTITTPALPVAAGQTWSSPNEIGHVLQPGASLWAFSSVASALNLTASGIMTTGAGL